MAFQKTNELVDTIVDTQKKVLDSVVENTKKFTNGNSPINETIEKGTDWYKNWLETQKSFFTKATSQESSNGKTTENGSAANKANEFFNQWMNMQANFAKQAWETAQDSAKKFAEGTNTNNMFAANPFMNNNPFANWQQNFAAMQNPWAAFMQNAQYNNWMNSMNSMNPFNAESMKKTNDSMMGAFNQYYTMLNNNFAEWQKALQNNTVQDAYKNMINAGEGFTKFAEMWMPMFKSMQDKTFNMDTYKNMMNPAMYKEFMDKYFGFMPEGSREQMNNMTEMMKNGMKQMSQAGMSNYTQMRDMMNNMSNATEFFGNMHSAYSQFNNFVNEAASPFGKMMTQNQYTKAAADWSELANRTVEYNLKNAELQYMIYSQGVKVMDSLAENVAKKVQEGTEINSMLGLYQEWMNISDKTYVALFESDEYSKLMGEVTSLQNRLRKDVDAQVEVLMKDIPVATRSEMEEVYKTIYDLKKQVRQLEKMLDIDGGEVKTEEAATEKAAKSKKKA